MIMWTPLGEQVQHGVYTQIRLCVGDKLPRQVFSKAWEGVWIKVMHYSKDQLYLNIRAQIDEVLK